VQSLNKARVAGMVGVAALVAVTASGCTPGRNHAGGPGIIPVSASVEQPATTGKATVGYLDIRNNGTAEDTLVSVSTSVGGTVELRAPVNPAATPIVMHTVPAVPLPAGQTTQLDPDSYHLLISGAGAMQDGKDIKLTLKFAHAAPITVYALVTNPQHGGSSYFLNG
jgi:periplasmic copper chaperone A